MVVTELQVKHIRLAYFMLVGTVSGLDTVSDNRIDTTSDIIKSIYNV